MGEINKILEKLNTSTHPNNAYTLCQEQMKYLRQEYILNRLMIKILSENQSAF